MTDKYDIKDTAEYQCGYADGVRAMQTALSEQEEAVVELGRTQ